jgi:TPR repeat protein
MARLEFDAIGGLESAAHGGTSDALYQLGLMYCVGRDVDVDLVQAHKWFNLAALRGNEEAKRYRGEISKEMSKPDIALAQKLAREWIATQ